MNTPKRKTRKIDGIYVWCHLGVSPEDEELIVTETGIVFHKNCYDHFLKEAMRAQGDPPVSE